jgi:tetratricopeptide (TPR) repeat protein
VSRPVLYRVLLPALALSVHLLGQRSLLEDAWTLASKGRASEAVTILYGLVKSEPRNAEARLLLGSLLVERGDRAGALEQLTEGVNLTPRSAEAQNALGEAYNRFNEPKTARTYFEKAITIDPGFAAAHVNLGLVLLQASEYVASTGHFEKAVRTFGSTPDAAYPQYLWAKALAALNDPKNAVQHLEQAVKLNPGMTEAWADLGQQRKLLQDDAGALLAEKRAVQLDPGDEIARYRLGAEYLRQNQLKLAVEQLQAAVRLDPGDQSALNALQVALRKDGKPEEAAAVKERLTELLVEKDRKNQDSVTAVQLNNEGAILQKSGDLEGALAKYAAAAKLYPSHPGIRVNHAVALLRLGHWTEGLTELNDSLQLNPDDAKVRAALKDALAQAPPEKIPPELRPRAIH